MSENQPAVQTRAESRLLARRKLQPPCRRAASCHPPMSAPLLCRPVPDAGGKSLEGSNTHREIRPFPAQTLAVRKRVPRQDDSTPLPHSARPTVKKTRSVRCEKRIERRIVGTMPPPEHVTHSGSPILSTCRLVSNENNLKSSPIVPHRVAQGTNLSKSYRVRSSRKFFESRGPAVNRLSINFAPEATWSRRE